MNLFYWPRIHSFGMCLAVDTVSGGESVGHQYEIPFQRINIDLIRSLYQRAQGFMLALMD